LHSAQAQARRGTVDVDTDRLLQINLRNGAVPYAICNPLQISDVRANIVELAICELAPVEHERNYCEIMLVVRFAISWFDSALDSMLEMLDFCWHKMQSSVAPFTVCIFRQEVKI
jgi:hypothetical protein